MSGHSKWATTKHQKAADDAKRGKVFAKLIKNIEVAAHIGGGDLAGNPTLYDAVQKAKKTSVPNDNIDRAIKRGVGGRGRGVRLATIIYEGYAPGGVAVLIECLTDNRNRAAAEVRTALTRNGGQLADPGSVAYVFDRRGVVIVPKGNGLTEDDLLEVVLDAGAEEVNDNGDTFEIVSDAADFVAVRTAVQAGRDRLRVGRGVVGPEPAGAARPRRRAEDDPRHRRARGQRRRPGRLRQRRHPRRRPRPARRGRVGPERRSARCSRLHGARPGSVVPNTCSVGARQGGYAGDARPRGRPRSDPLRHRSRRGRPGPPAADGRRRRLPHRRRLPIAGAAAVARRPTSTRGSGATTPTPSPSSGSSPTSTSRASWAPRRPRRWRCSPPRRAASRCTCTPPPRSRPP